MFSRKNKESEIQTKYRAIRNAIIKFFEDLDGANGKPVEIPAFLRADQILDKVIVTKKDLDFFYNKLIQYQKAGA